MREDRNFAPGAFLRRLSLLFVLGVVLGLAVACGGAGGGEQGGDYPTQDIEFIVPYDPGGGYDSWARLMAPFIEKHLPNDATVVVRNVPGAGGLTATNQVFAAQPDGTRIEIMDLVGLAGAQIGGQANFDLREFTYLGTLTIDPRILAVAGDSEMETMEQLQERAPLRQGVAGLTTSDGVAMIVLYDTLGIEYTPVMHDGNSEARLSVIRGDTEANITSIESAVGELESGDLKPVLYIGEPLEEGAPGYEEVQGVQTIAELGYPELNDLAAPRVIGAPPDLPDDIRQTLDNAIRDAMADPDFQAQAEESQLTPVARNADETTELVDTTIDTLSEYEEALRSALEGSQ